MNLKELRTKITHLQCQHRILETDLARLHAEETRLAQQAREVEEARAFLQRAAQRVQEQTHKQLAAIVSRCLAAVFPNPYELRIHFVEKRGKTEAELVFYRDGVEADPLTSAGGGVVDVAAFALRVAALSMQRPRPRPLLVMDEPFRFVDRANRHYVRALLESLSKELGIQFIIVTHHPELYEGGAGETAVVEIEGSAQE